MLELKSFNVVIILTNCLLPSGATWEGDQELNAHPTAIISLSDDESGYFERLGAKTESVLETFFTKWGTYCASKPWLVLFLGKWKRIRFWSGRSIFTDLQIVAGFCFLVSMGHGIKYLNITTNPVELWASPSSRARVEREFFDSKFNPFYRIEQVCTQNALICSRLSQLTTTFSCR